MDEILPQLPKRRPRRRWLKGLLLLGAIVALGLWLRPAPPPPPPPKPAAPAGNQARMETLALSEIQEGEKRWSLEARKADFLKESNEISLKDIKAEFFQKNEPPISVTAQEGRLNTKTRVLTLQGRVQMDRGELRITTDLATYQPAGRLLLVPAEVTLADPRIRVQGKELTVNLVEKKLVLAQHRLTEIKVQGGWLKP